MAAFHYDALNGTGSKVHGVLEAENLRVARTQLRESGLLVLEVRAVSRHALSPGMWFAFEKWRPGGKVSPTQLSLMTRQMATLLAAGMTLEQTLSAVIEQSDPGVLRPLMAGVRAEILSGKTLAMALGQYDAAFPAVYRAIVQAGESSGTLDDVMVRLADYIESRQALRQKVGLAFIYPAIVTLVALLVVTGLLMYVVPQVVDVFRHTKQQLPLLTRMILGLSALLQATWPYLALAAIVAAPGSRLLLQRESIKYSLHLWLLKLPLAGRLVRGINSARMASTLSILVGSGVPLLDAMHSACGVIDNLPMKRALEEAAQKVREGTGLSHALTATGHFPPIMVHLVASGESSGKLDAMLARAAVQQEQEVDGLVSALTALLEPLLILVMGIVVLLIVLAILMPIIDMNQMIR